MQFENWYQNENDGSLNFAVMPFIVARVQSHNPHYVCAVFDRIWSDVSSLSRWVW